MNINELIERQREFIGGELGNATADALLAHQEGRGVMSNAKHTPGPWGVIVGDSGPIVFSGNKGDMVATCLRKITSAEREANARLIAAAPELLAALERLLSGNDEEAWYAEIEARAVIAKARGE